MNVFISHITEEASLASVLKEWVESTFLGQVDVFVSKHDISLGQQWFRRLEEELTDAKAMLVLCSKRSVSMPWINFETGAVHNKGIPVIPVCYAGITTDTLPAPLRFFQGLDATAEDFGVKIIADLAKHLGYTRTPVIRYEEMTAKVQEALAQIEKGSGQNAVGELGNVDHLVVFTEKMEQLTNLMSKVQQALEPTGEESGEESGQNAGEESGEESGQNAGEESGEESGQNAGEESGGVNHLGYVDHLVVFTEKTEELTNLVSEFGESTNEMAIGINTFSEQLDDVGNNPSSGTPRHIQHLARRFGEDLSIYAGKIGDLNRKYGETLPEIQGSLQSVLTFATFESQVEMDVFLATLDETEQAVSAWKHSAVEARATIDSLPNVQREMSRAARKIVEEFDTLASNLTDTLAMIQEAKFTCYRRSGSSGPD